MGKFRVNGMKVYSIYEDSFVKKHAFLYRRSKQRNGFLVIKF